MVGGARNGYCSKLSLRSEYVPSSTVRMAMTIATIGRRMKNPAMVRLASALGLRRGRRCWGRRRRRRGRLSRRRHSVGGRPELGLHHDPGPHLLEALDDHALAGLEPGRDDVEVLVGLAQGQGAHRDLVVLAD